MTKQNIRIHNVFAAFAAILAVVSLLYIVIFVCALHKMPYLSIVAYVASLWLMHRMLRHVRRYKSLDEMEDMLARCYGAAVEHEVFDQIVNGTGEKHRRPRRTMPTYFTRYRPLPPGSTARKRKDGR